MVFFVMSFMRIIVYLLNVSQNARHRCETRTLRHEAHFTAVVRG